MRAFNTLAILKISAIMARNTPLLVLALLTPPRTAQACFIPQIIHRIAGSGTAETNRAIHTMLAIV